MFRRISAAEPFGRCPRQSDRRGSPIVNLRSLPQFTSDRRCHRRTEAPWTSRFGSQRLAGLASALGLVAFMASSPVPAQWTPEGPGPSNDGQVEGVANGEVVGAVQALVAHPTQVGTLYAGGVNGGLWKTTNATAASPSWVFQSGNLASQSISSLAFDRTDANFNTLIAGIGRYSSLGRIGGRRIGVVYTTDGGTTWTVPSADLAGANIAGVAAAGNILLAAVDMADDFTCSNVGVYRSTDTGASWQPLDLTDGLPRGSARALAQDPTNPAILYASVVFADACSSSENGIYKSVDTGATWSKVSNAAMDANLVDSSNTHVDISVGAANNLFVAIAPNGSLAGVYHSTDGGGSFSSMGVPTTLESGNLVGIHPGGQGAIHMSLAADLLDPNVVYIGGDRQPRGFRDTGTFPNSIGAQDFSGRLFRGFVSAGLGMQWEPLTHNGTPSNSAPHADSRAMAMDAGGSLVEGDDGGVYRRLLPQTNLGDWVSVNGDLRTNEMHSTAYDPVSDIIIGGAQDNGTPQQMTPGGTRWMSVSTADGGDVAVDAISTPGQSTRYSSFQGLQAFARRTYDAGNNLLSALGVGLNVVGGGSPLQGQFVTPVAVNGADGLRLLIGGGNSVYESLDQGDTLTEIGPGIVTLAFGRSTVAYGVPGNAGLIYLGGCQGSCTDGGDGADGIFVRSAGAAALAHSFTPDGTVRGVTVDPDNGAQAFLTTATTVYQTVTTGASWSPITGNLASFDPGILRAVRYIDKSAGDDALVVGSERGVFMALASDNFSVWSRLGTGLPDVSAVDMDYDSASDKLVVGTLGQGAFSISPVSVSSDQIFADGFETGGTAGWSLAVP